MKKDGIRKKIHSPKSLQKHVTYYSSEKKHHSSKYNNNKSASNDGNAFATVTEEKEKNLT